MSVISQIQQTHLRTFPPLIGQATPHSALESQGLVLDRDLGLGLVQPMMPIDTRFSPSYPVGRGMSLKFLLRQGS